METNNITENSKIQMRRGILEYSILLVLQHRDDYASSIIQKLKDVDIIIVEGTLYPLLIRLKNLGLLSYRWEESPQGPPRKYYMITDKGREQLKELDATWEELVRSVETIKNLRPEIQDATEMCIAGANGTI
ncbi:MAG: PadR family transcriptional regulator [Bacteroidales bacterium]|nr:PadR family transcriptional regulator [Bacteroides sp.]MCM1197559.1 PadR family transcriptional regulator [Clostridium sp.]MCM1502225.1 PadR family transcriptional regulator [Bacteroidales bacterium]